MIRVALTGGIGSGKSSVSRLLAELGAEVIDADQIARDLVVPGEPALDEITRRFGTAIRNEDGTLDRGALAARVFGDPDELAALNRIMHPRIEFRARELLGRAGAGSVVVYDMPLLVENGLSDDWDWVLVVEAPTEERIRRLMADRGMTADQIRERIAAQADDPARRSLADIVIDNSGDRQHLVGEVDRAWRQITAGRQRASGS